MDFIGATLIQMQTGWTNTPFTRSSRHGANVEQTSNNYIC